MSADASACYCTTNYCTANVKVTGPDEGAVPPAVAFTVIV